MGRASQVVHSRKSCVWSASVVEWVMSGLMAAATHKKTQDAIHPHAACEDLLPAQS